MVSFNRFSNFFSSIDSSFFETTEATKVIDLKIQDAVEKMLPQLENTSESIPRPLLEKTVRHLEGLINSCYAEDLISNNS